MTFQYKPKDIEDRRKIAKACLESQNGHRAFYAKEIIDGDLLRSDGLPKSYWHCLATQEPPIPLMRRGRWKAEEEYEAGWQWVWNDWGPLK